MAIVKVDADGWVYGKNFGNDEVGWFPTSFVLDAEVAERECLAAAERELAVAEEEEEYAYEPRFFQIKSQFLCAHSSEIHT